MRKNYKQIFELKQDLSGLIYFTDQYEQNQY